MMKKNLVLMLLLAVWGTVYGYGMTSRRALRDEARLLTDRMAYELGLTPQQCEDCYEINYDFLCSVDPIMGRVIDGYAGYSDQYYDWLDMRNEDLRYILDRTQYVAFLGLDYLLRPLHILAGTWRLSLYSVYSNPHFFYYAPPRAYTYYRGVHARRYYPRGFYAGRYRHPIYDHPHVLHRPAPRPGGSHHPGALGPARPGHSGAAHPGGARPGDVRPGGGQAGGARHDGVRPGGGQAGGARPDASGSVHNGGQAGHPNGGSIGSHGGGSGARSGGASVPRGSAGTRSGSASVRGGAGTRGGGAGSHGGGASRSGASRGSSAQSHRR